MTNEIVRYSQENLALLRSVLNAKEAPDDVLMTAIAYCQAAKLDPMKKPIAIISFKGEHQIVFTYQAITTVASRAGWAGQDEIVFSDERVQIDGKQYPAYGYQTVYKMVQGQRCAFTGPKVYLAERHRSAWSKAGIMAMYQKCITSAALRLACPEELAQAYIEEEMPQAAPMVDVDNSGIDRLKMTATVVDESELQGMIDSINACNTVVELETVGNAIKEYTTLTDDERKQAGEVYKKRLKELKASA